MGGQHSSNNPIDKFIAECSLKKLYSLTIDELKVGVLLI
jgi:hypothetical protein